MIPAPGVSVSTPTQIPFDVLPGFRVEYLVRPGDSIDSIALVLRSTIDDILAYNNLDDPNEIYPGQILLVRVNLVTPEPTSNSAILTRSTPFIPEEYLLHEGEYLFCLARRFNILPDYISEYNGFESFHLHYPGEIISIPIDGPSYIGDRSLQYHPTTYEVVYGDTLYSIACLFGDVFPESIAELNGIDLEDQLTPGHFLQIP